MSPTFWTNTIWYVLLGIITVVELIFILAKREKRIINTAFYLTIFGITLNFEMIILIYFKAYCYYPMIIKYPPIPFDNVLAGNLISQSSVAATILLVAVFNLKYYWFFIFAGIYGMIEKFFLALGIYTHNWYRTWITVVMLLIAFVIAKKMYVKTVHNIKPLLYYGYIFSALFPLFIVLLQWPLQLLRFQDFSESLFRDPIISRHFLALIHFLILSVPMMFIYFSKVRFFWKFITLVLIYMAYFFGYKTYLVFIKQGYFLFVSAISTIWMCISIFLIDGLYGKPLKK